MTRETQDRLKTELDALREEKDLTVREMELIDNVRAGLDEEDESEGALKMWEAKYKELEASYQGVVEENARVTEAYRKRWDEATVGTKVNGEYVDKTVTDVSDYTYEKLLGFDS